MRFSVSLKVFLGFIAVLTAFGAASVFQIVRSGQLQEDLSRLNKVYLQLNDVYRAMDTRVTQLQSLHRNIGDLIKTGSGARSRSHFSRYLPLAQRYRDKWLQDVRQLALQGLKIDLPASSRVFLNQALGEVRKLVEQFKREDRLYAEAFADKQLPPPAVDRDRLTSGQQRLLRGMSPARRLLSRLSIKLRRILTQNLSGQVKQTARRLENTETRTLIYSVVLTIFAGLIAVAMMLMAHFTQRPLRVLREGSRVIGKGDYDHRVKISARDELGELAAEFNAMAEAIQEREQRLIETERLAAKAERLATVGRAAAQITHEVRNPLSAIGLNAEMVEEELASLSSDEEPVREARSLLAAILKEVDRLTEVTEAYLQFARVPTPRMEEDDLASVVSDTLTFVEGELRAANIEVALALEEVPRFTFDENRIRQALLNLIRNAREAMSPEGGVLTLAIRTAKEHDAVELSVADTGCGMTEEQVRQVFDPFYSTKEKGTGLGLAITSQIVEEHGGAVWAESRPGKGTRFVLSLPLSASAPPSASQPS